MALGFNLLGERGRRLQGVLHGTWLGHPIHPALTDVPLGAWTAGLALDGIDMISPRSGGLGRSRPHRERVRHPRRLQGSCDRRRRLAVHPRHRARALG